MKTASLLIFVSLLGYQAHAETTANICGQISPYACGEDGCAYVLNDPQTHKDYNVVAGNKYIAKQLDAYAQDPLANSNFVCVTGVTDDSGWGWVTATAASMTPSR